MVGQIQRERLVPQFERGDYSQGIFDTVQAYVATLAEKRGFSIDGIDQSYAYRAPRERPRTQPRGAVPSSCCTLAIIAFIVIIILLSMRRGGGSGCLNMFLLGSLLNNGRRGGWGGSSGWGGGGFGGGGGGFGGGGGGLERFGGVGSLEVVEPGVAGSWQQCYGLRFFYAVS